MRKVALDKTQVSLVKKIYKTQKKTQQEIANFFNVSIGTVNNALRGESVYN